MARTSKKERDAFIAVLVGECRKRDPLQVANIAAKIMRQAATIARLAEKDCNEGLTEADRAKDKLAEIAIRKLCDELPGVKPKFSGDPRGYTVKLLLPSGLYNTWGGKDDGWGVPNS